MGTAVRGRRDSSFASCRAGGLWPRPEGPSDLFGATLAASTALWGFNSVLWGFNSAARVIIWAGSRGRRLRYGNFRQQREAVTMPAR